MLAGDLDSSVEGDRAVLERLLELLVSELDIKTPTNTLTEQPREDKQELQQTIAALESFGSDMDTQDDSSPPVHERTYRRELQLVIMRLLSKCRRSYMKYLMQSVCRLISESSELHL